MADDLPAVQFKVSRLLLDQMFKLDAVEGRIVGAAFDEHTVTFDVETPRAPADTVAMRPVIGGTCPNDATLVSVDWIGPDGMSTTEEIG